MSDTRNFKSPGVFAADAVTVIPPTPTLGVTYRDPATTVDETEAGWPFGIKVNSEAFNQIMYLMSSMLKMQDQQGLLGWTATVDYVAGALVMGSDGLTYRARIVNGPATGNGVDPTLVQSIWERYGAPAASSNEVELAAIGDKYVSPFTLLNGFLPSNSVVGSSGVARIPINVGGAKFNLVLQWGGGSQSNGASVNFPVPFPVACFRVIGSDSNGLQSFGSQGKTQSGFTLRTNAGGTLQYDYLAIGI